MGRIFFYNHAHNGDLFLSRHFIKSIIDAMPDFEFYYLHQNSHKVLLDLKVKQGSINTVDLPKFEKFYDNGKDFFINTWIRNYLDLGDGINLQTLYKMYKIIFDNIFSKFGIKIKIKDVHEYFPEINFNLYDVPLDLDLDYENTIMFSNGPVYSGQSNLFDTNIIVLFLLTNFPDKKIILTHQSDIESPNILYTSNLIKTTGADLNEISWIAEKCKYIIGRNSGPFCFMHTKNILNNKTKKIISFGSTDTLSFIYQIDVEADYVILLDDNLNNLFQGIWDAWT